MGNNGQPAPPLKKPSLVSQLIPYFFAAGILAWVFTGLSSNVVGERCRLQGREWSALEGVGARPSSVKLKSLDGSVKYCGPVEVEQKKEGTPAWSACPDAGDFEVRSGEDRVSLRRAEGSRIGDGSEVAVDYVKKIRPADIMAILRQADLSLFLPVMIGYVIVFFLADVFSFGMAYRWFSVPGLKVREMMVIRGAPYVIQIGLAPLAEVLFPLYLLRVKKVPITDALSSTIWVLILDLGAMLSLVTPGVLYNLYGDNLIPDIGFPWLWGCVIFWTLFFGNLIFWHSSLRERAAAWIASGREGSAAKSKVQRTVGELMQLLRTFSLARWRQYLRVYLTRLALIGMGVLANYVALRAMGVNPSLPLAFIAVPIVIVSIFLPIGVGGYGGPQLVAWFLFAHYGQAGTADQVIAYSLLFSTSFLVGRAIVGAIFIRSFWRRTFPEGFSI